MVLELLVFGFFKANKMDIAKRFKENPILQPGDILPSSEQSEIECLLNPGVFRFEDKVWLLVRVAEKPIQQAEKISVNILDENIGVKTIVFDKNNADLDLSDPRVITYKGEYYLTTLSHFRLFSSKNGKDFKEETDFEPIHGKGKQEEFGIEDCRIVYLDGMYHLTYTQISSMGVGVGYMHTQTWKEFVRKGMIFPPHNKDCTFFNEKINGKYYALHRPSSAEIGGNYIWLAESNNLVHWGNHICIAQTRPGSWDSARIGAGASPIRTSDGWLEIYHGADNTNRYCLGALLLDLEDPSIVISRTKEPIMEPVMEYEQNGFFGSVIFTNGHLVDGDELTIYYGASDSVVCGATFSINQILALLK